MAMAPRLRKFALTAHIATSVGWLGAVTVFLVLALASLTVDDPNTVRAVHLSMEVAGWWVLVPLALASLVTGVIQGLGTTWGLFQHYWVVFKLLITVVATGVLLLYTQTIGQMADLAASDVGVGALRNPSPVLHSGLGVVLLLAAAGLSVYKPRGRTRRGWRKQRELVAQQ